MQDLSIGPLIFLSFLLFYCLFSQFSGDFLIYLFNSSDFFFKLYFHIFILYNSDFLFLNHPILHITSSFYFK